MILLDTTVLAYAVGSDHELREPCRALIAAIGDGSVSATTTIEVIQEFAHIRARRHGRAEAAATASHFVDLLSPLVPVEEPELREGLQLFQIHDRLGSFDAVLATVAMRRDQLAGVASADRAFSSVAGLAHHDPRDPGFLDGLR